MKKMIALVAVLAMTSVSYGVEKAKADKLDSAAPAAKSKKAVKAPKKAAKIEKSAGAAPVAEPSSAVTPATTVPAAGASVETVAPTTATALIGELDLRPTWSHKVGEYHTENEAVLGYKLNKTTSITAHQLFNTNLHNPAIAPTGLNLMAKDGFVKLKANSLMGDPSGVEFSYEVRGYVPTDKLKRDNGMITVVRNYFKAKHDFNNTFYTVAAAVPIVHVYSRAGEGAVANPIFENRVYLIGGVNILSNLSFELPVVLQSVRHRNYQAGAANNNGWAHYLWVYPELLYSVTPNVAVGASWYNDSFISSDFKSFSLKQGFESGYAQAVVRATL